MSLNKSPRTQRPIVLRSLFTVLLLVTSCLSSFSAYGQSGAATLSGEVVDQNGAVVPGAAVMIVNPSTGFTRETATNDSGVYNFPSLAPGSYSVTVRRDGFAPIEVKSVVLNVGDRKALQIQLKAGDINATVQVVNDAPLINQSPAVGTVVDRRYVENMPLNGRSFHDLILLTPGVVTNNPQTQAGGGIGVSGEFSVNGQRTESNYYSVDGVSANLSFSLATNTPGVSGSLPGTTALGTTQSLVSVDALEEFRVQGSSYSAEYGRNPGGQFSFATRSGTNQWHGNGFEYLRNNVFDANDWFNNYFGRSKPPERQNDFGGTVGGPVLLPRFGEGGSQPWYNGRNRTFFFLSYEGLRLSQPQAATVNFVPDANLRSNTPAPLKQVINAFPQPNGATFGNGLAQFIGTWSNPSTINSTSFRIDQVVADKTRLFFRFSNTASNVGGRNAFVPSIEQATSLSTRTYTFGATSSFSSKLTNEFRLNFSTNRGTQSAIPGSFGGAIPVDLIQLQGFAVGQNPSPQVALTLGIAGQFLVMRQSASAGQQKQWNVVDTVALSWGAHQLKFGFDFRRLNPSILQQSPASQYVFTSATSVLANSVDVGLGQSNAPGFPIYRNFSAFIQDEWRVRPRLNLSLGLRWEVNPAPGDANGNVPFTVQGNSLSTLSLAPQGTPLWKTGWHNFAPRLGASYVLRTKPGFETIVRGGGGVFFDTGQQLGSFGYGGPGFAAQSPLFGAVFSSPASFPAPVAKVSPPIVSPPVAPYTSPVFAFPTHLQLPFTLQWNASVEQSLGKSQALTVSYVGANGRRLLEFAQSNISAFNSKFPNIVFISSGLTSYYDALEARYQRRLSHGLQALGSYTWSHCIDYASRDSSVPYQRGNCDFDVRHNFSSALSYDLPNALKNGAARAVLHHWSLDGRFSARTGFPVTLNGNRVLNATTGQFFFGGLNVISGQPLYVSGSQCAALYNNGKGCPGGRAINPSAFSLPVGANPGNAPRNFVRGFGAWQIDLAVRREFPIFERLKLQFRAEAFNILNHPNFGTINPTFCAAGPACTFGQATATEAQSLGGLSSLYQLGGPRSMQFALKLVF